MNERLNKIIAKSGICSRRKADELIAKGKVTLNGQIVTALGTQADIKKDKILVNNKPLRTEKKIYVVLNKPVGYTTTIKDPHAQKPITLLFPKISERLFPVGRLDKDTSGLIILTNDGNLSYKLTHPKFKIDRVYEVTIKNYLNTSEVKKIEKGGLTIEDYLTHPCKIKILHVNKLKTKLRLTLHEGKKRQIRKMFELLNHPVIELKRIQFGKLKLGDLKEGKFVHIKKSNLL